MSSQSSKSQHIAKTKKKIKENLLSIDGVIAVGVSEKGIVVTTLKKSIMLPNEIDGVKIIQKISNQVKPMCP
jgi:hypothetical protein